MRQIHFETLASGYGLVEAPTADPAGGLFFSDVLGGGVHHLASDGSLTTVVPKRRGVGGLALHADGGLIASGRGLIHVKDGESRPLPSVEGVAGWNDLCTDASGRVYAGSLRFAVFDPNAEAVPGECWRFDPDGSATSLYSGLVHANGVGISPDGRTLYHSDTRRCVIVVHDLDGDRGVTHRREFPVPDGGRPDGLALDEAGCIWVAIAGGGRVDRFTPDGRLDSRLEVPARVVTSLCFAGADRRELIVVSADHREEPERRGSVFRGRAPVAGAPVHAARV